MCLSDDRDTENGASVITIVVPVCVVYLSQVCHYLTFTDLCQLRRTCRFFAALVDADNLVWRTVFLRDWGPERFSNVRGTDHLPLDHPWRAAYVNMAVTARATLQGRFMEFRGVFADDGRDGASEFTFHMHLHCSEMLGVDRVVVMPPLISARGDAVRAAVASLQADNMATWPPDAPVPAVLDATAEAPPYPTYMNTPDLEVPPGYFSAPTEVSPQWLTEDMTQDIVRRGIRKLVHTVMPEELYAIQDRHTWAATAPVGHAGCDGAVPMQGAIEWTLTKSPSWMDAGLIGDSALEYVRGWFDTNTRRLFLTGVCLDIRGHGLISCDAYKFTISQDGHSFAGHSRAMPTLWPLPGEVEALGWKSRICGASPVLFDNVLDLCHVRVTETSPQDDAWGGDC